MTDIQDAYFEHGIQLDPYAANPLRFSFANGTRDHSYTAMPIPFVRLNIVLSVRVLNAPGPILIGEDVHRRYKLVVDHETGWVYSKLLDRGFQAGRGLLVEGGDADIADIVDHPGAHGPDLDDRTGEGDVEGLLGAAPDGDGQI